MSHPEVPSTAAVPSSPARPNCSFKGLELRSCVSGEAFPDRQSRAVGVARNDQLPAHFVIDGQSRLAFAAGVRIVRSDGRTFPTRPAPPPWFDPYSVALGVGSNEPQSLPLVRGTNVVSTHHERPAGVAECLQFNEEPVDASSSETRAVLKSAPTRSALADDADGFEEQAGALAVDALALGVRGAGVLAGRGSDDGVREGEAIGNKSICPDSADIVIEPRFGEVPAEDGAAPRVNFAGGDRAEACAVQAERPAATRAAEKIEDSRPVHAATPDFRFPGNGW